MNKLGKEYLFSNDGETWHLRKLTRIDNHGYPYCAGYCRYKFIKEVGLESELKTLFDLHEEADWSDIGNHIALRIEFAEDYELLLDGLAHGNSIVTGKHF